MHRNQAVAVQIHADHYTIIGDSILIAPTDADVRRVKAHLVPNRDGDIAMQLTLTHPHHGPIDVTESAYGSNTPASRLAGIVDDYVTFWFGDQADAHSEL
ncbi:hypothetical protein ACIGO7_07920 [Streptomyces virginiae]|uniref:hypothetical protein n=1 Tax=Streptomyces virginiae TaxID=1961 RepID=UPI00344F3C2E